VLMMVKTRSKREIAHSRGEGGESSDMIWAASQSWGADENSGRLLLTIDMRLSENKEAS
jgi:hypothetical protein